MPASSDIHPATPQRERPWGSARVPGVRGAVGVSGAAGVTAQVGQRA
ncbi:hypothetical protein [Cellulomonas denverensis]|nr:hypothetical protein [Cellulomonas denverensis]